MPDYIPANDNDLKVWLKAFSEAMEAYKETFGVSDQDVALLSQGKADFEAALADHYQKQIAAQAATARKRNSRDALVQTVRRLSRQVDNHPEMTNEIRAAMGLNCKGESRTRRSVGNEVPAISLEAHTNCVIVHFGDAPSNEQRNGKPSWAKGCNIYRKRDGEEEYQFVAFEISSPYVDEITGPPTGYSYIVQYRGQKAKDLGNSSIPAWIAAGGQLAA